MNTDRKGKRGEHTVPRALRPRAGKKESQQWSLRMLLAWQEETQKNISWEPKKEDVLKRGRWLPTLSKVAEKLNENINLYKKKTHRNMKQKIRGSIVICVGKLVYIGL